MLEHAHAHDLVERFVAEVTVVFQFDSDPTIKSSVSDFFVGVGFLIFAERHAQHFYSVFQRGVPRQPSPSAADVEQSFAGLQSQFAADVFHLAFLRDVQFFRAGRKISARILQVAVEPQRIKIVAYIIMVLDGKQIAFA